MSTGSGPLVVKVPGETWIQILTHTQLRGLSMWCRCEVTCCSMAWMDNLCISDHHVMDVVCFQSTLLGKELPWMPATCCVHACVHFSGRVPGGGNARSGGYSVSHVLRKHTTAFPAAALFHVPTSPVSGANVSTSQDACYLF